MVTKMKDLPSAALMVFFCLTPVSYSQGQIISEPRDTIVRTVKLDTIRYSFLEQPNFIPLSFAIASENTLSLLDQSILFPTQSFSWTIENNKIDLSAPWKLELARREENRTMYTILGSVNFGGAMYIAYRHVKKYGFK
jgi:hypothetical protein